MNLGELLEELRENILHDRSDQVAGNASDYLWSRKTLIRYINQAQRKLCREGLILRDATTPDCCELQLVAFQREYALHPSVIGVVSAKVKGDRADLARAGHSAFQTYHTPDSRFFNPSQLSTVPPGKVLAYGTDEEVTQDNGGSLSVMTFRAFPKPDPLHAGVVQLRVVRGPLHPLENDNDIPEVPEDHHLNMLTWAAYLALRMVDHELGDPARAQEFKIEFEATVAAAKKEFMRKMFTPLPWGFGRNGFTYERDYQ